ncbi:hypothetical protein [[Limnothrix rosea] IAM M-220]|uniref:O-linked N-acetylglucosamine transferase family protein n=1 Tax=[Limnothrix rosea] IAM M-220 TaxID=454133 RepID=UPI00095992C4|nr:hypothetical protein [[Limnothrix rosea] IAM M-220]OKH10891.1 hypothetical protein NIES208_18070 [[Limnothrix rosea] IAM M-220]
MSTSQKLNLPDFKPHEILDLFLAQKTEAIATQYLSILDHFKQRTDRQITIPLQTYIDQFLGNFFYTFSQAKLVLPEDYLRAFIRRNKIIATLAAISSFQNTDPYLKILSTQPENLGKALALYSPRNEFYFDYNKIFTTNPDLACYWYSYIFSHYATGLAHENIAKRIYFHATYDHPNLTRFYNYPDIYCSATYIAPNLDRLLKYKINLFVQQSSAPQTNAQQQYDKKKIAIVSSSWSPQSSIYRNLSTYIAALANKYELTLIYCGEKNELVDQDFFKQIIYIKAKDNSLNYDQLHGNQFSLIYFTDIGVNTESILLANFRLSPIQCCGLGHPVSTYGAKIDYFISGQTVEIPTESTQFYSENLILLPNLGVVHHPPPYQRRERQHFQNSRIIINCPWSAQKINFSLLKTLKRITEKTPEPPLFRFFCGHSLNQNSYLVFTQDIASVLPREYFELVPAIANQDYLALMETGDMTLDSFHVGGCHSIIESLYLYKPTVVFEGDRWYNRVGAQLLRQVGLMDLIATTKKDYIHMALKLILDKKYRQTVGDRLREVDFEKTIFNTTEIQSFKKAIDSLIANLR